MRWLGRLELKAVADGRCLSGAPMDCATVSTTANENQRVAPSQVHAENGGGSVVSARSVIFASGQLGVWK